MAVTGRDTNDMAACSYELFLEGAWAGKARQLDRVQRAWRFSRITAVG